MVTKQSFFAPAAVGTYCRVVEKDIAANIPRRVNERQFAVLAASCAKRLTAVR